MITQGTWEVSKPHKISERRFKCIISTVDGPVVAFAYGDSTKEAHDNARLFAAAPALLAACKQYVKDSAKHLCRSDRMSGANLAIKAIAKAENN